MYAWFVTSIVIKVAEVTGWDWDTRGCNGLGLGRPWSRWLISSFFPSIDAEYLRSKSEYNGDDGSLRLVLPSCRQPGRLRVHPYHGLHFSNALYLTRHLSGRENYIITIAHNQDRLWRKNLQPNNGTICIGTDPNRNFGYLWNGRCLSFTCLLI